jgi:copper(I)-binding protein
MLQRPVHPLRKGMTVLLTLHFAKAGELTIRVPVVAATGLVSAGQTMSGMDMG